MNRPHMLFCGGAVHSSTGLAVWGWGQHCLPSPHHLIPHSPSSPSHPTSSLADISKVQDAEVGDGTTSVVVFAAELLKEAEQLVAEKLHPQTIIAGWRKATDCARAALTAAAKDHSLVGGVEGVWHRGSPYRGLPPLLPPLS